MSDPVTRINALTANSRNTWLVMLAALIFVGVTLMQVKPIDFYGVNRATQLPLVNIAVPTRLFFIGAPILIAAVYGYFHLYLIRLWDALGTAPARIEGTRLSEAVSPWLVTDAALFLRSRLRQDNCTTPRTMELPSMIFNIALAWVAGLVILGWLLWASAPARTFSLSIWPALSLGLGLFVGFASLAQFVLRMRSPEAGRTTRLWTLPVRATLSLLVLALIWGTWERTEGDRWLVDLVLTGEQIVERPEGWQPREIARKEALAKWCKREPNVDCKALTPEEEQVFEKEWAVLRDTAIGDLKKPGWNPLRWKSAGEGVVENIETNETWVNFSGYSKQSDTTNWLLFAHGWKKSYDFRNANIREVFATGANLIAADMQGVEAQRANFEGADLSFANLKGQNTDLSAVNLTGAKLRFAQLDDAILWSANLHSGDLEAATLNGAILERANLQEANFSWANLRRALFTGADLRATNFAWTDLREATLVEARLLSVDLDWAYLQQADISRSYMAGHKGEHTRLSGTNFEATKNLGGAIRYVEATEAIFDYRTDWRNTFLDGTVNLPEQLRRRLGRPCQWTEKKLDDEQFFGFWRGWVEHGTAHDWKRLPIPTEFKNVTPIPPPPGCEWKTGPLVHFSGGR